MNRKYRKTVIAGNWKMNKTPSETKEFMTEFRSLVRCGAVRACRLHFRSGSRDARDQSRHRR